MPVRAKFASIKHVDPSNVFSGNGSDEVIDLLMRVFCTPGIDNVITLPPTYGMYAVSAAVNDVNVKEVLLKDDWQLDVDAILHAADQFTKLLFICSPNNPTARVPVSVESIKGYFQLAQEDLKINDEENLKDIMINLSNQVHPLVLGDVYRSRTQIQMLAKKLLSKQMDNKEKIDKIISFLCSDSGSHDYSIYRREARDELGLNIEKPDDDFYQIIKSTFNDIKSELELNIPYDPNVVLGTQMTANYNARRILIESLQFGAHVFVSEGTLVKNIQTIPQLPPLPPIQRTLIDDQRKFEGWRTEEQKLI